MKIKIRTMLLVVPVILILAACASLNLPGTTNTSNASAQQNQTGGAVANTGSMPVADKLALGTLKLEGSANAVTAAQAKTLLPLWKAVKSLSSSSTASSAEITALYQQIQDAMTADQVTAIKDLNLSQTDLQALMKQYGVTMQATNGNFPTMSPAQQATRQAARSSGSNSAGGANGGGGPFGGPGGAPPDGGGFPGGPIGGGTGSTSGQPNAQGTPQARPAGGGFRGGMNSLLADPLIKVLEQRASS